ncbi:MAG: 3-hydroxybutyryl-CoA dehydrogenase [Deltaproteobacteria bacterium]|nr:3-hydroxybutyryl-CoA dehydrogenase [Deltaproteobacteria bacterium]
MIRIMIIGAGAMGSGIAQVAAQAGYNVILNDVTEEFVSKGMDSISGNLDRQVKKERISIDDKKAITDRVTPSASLEDGKDADFVLEAIFEDFEAKKTLFEKLDDICKPETIFASNTSSIPITRLAATVKRPEKFIGMHFFNPAPVMKLVEIIHGLKTSEETIVITEQIAASMEKTSVRVKDVPGFLVNRINNAMRNEAKNCLLEGVATIEDIDTALKLGLRLPLGPFELEDFVGLDVALSVSKTLYDGYKDVKWRPNRAMEQLAISGDLGRKTGKGWYDYTSGEKKPRKDIKF